MEASEFCVWCRLLKADGASSSARVYIAFGGTQALQPLAAEFPNLVSREMLAQQGELSPYINKSFALAANDYIVSLNSNFFVPRKHGPRVNAQEISY